jgi:TatA/E family protein of Tat protein translocase
MFGMSVFELMFVFVIALLVFGPEKLPEMAKKLGKASGELKKHSDNVRREFYNAIYPPTEEIGYRNLKSLPANTDAVMLKDDVSPNTLSNEDFKDSVGEKKEGKEGENNEQ